MCRYAIKGYKPHYACFECRKTFKRRQMFDINRGSDDRQPYKCPECGGLTASMGLDFESPKKSNLKAWNHIKDLYRTGITFHSCGCSGPGYIPRDKNTLIDFFNEKREIYIKNLRFCITNEKLQTENTKHKDFYSYELLLYSSPIKLKKGMQKIPKNDLKKAVEYWTEKVNEIEQNLTKLTGNTVYINP
jgi:DNA-directed RNA polymerase subunit RPC12/RpoP